MLLTAIEMRHGGGYGGVYGIQPTNNSPHRSYGHVSPSKQLGSSYYQTYMTSPSNRMPSNYPSSSPVSSPVPGLSSIYQPTSTASFQSPIQPQPTASTYPASGMATSSVASSRVGVAERRDELLYGPGRGLLRNHPVPGIQQAQQQAQQPASPPKPAQSTPWPANVVGNVGSTMSNLAAQRLRYSQGGAPAASSPLQHATSDPPEKTPQPATSSSSSEAVGPSGTAGQHRSYYESYQDRMNQSRQERHLPPRPTDTIHTPTITPHALLPQCPEPPCRPGKERGGGDQRHKHRAAPRQAAADAG